MKIFDKYFKKRERVQFDEAFTAALNRLVGRNPIKIEGNDATLKSINYRNEYKQSTTATSCGFRIISDVIDFPYKAGKLLRNDNGDLVPEASSKSELNKFLLSPNAQQDFKQFLEYHLINLFCDGESFTISPEVGSTSYSNDTAVKPVNLMPLNKSEVSIIESDTDGFYKSFTWSKKGKSYAPEQVGYHRWAIDPTNMSRGYGPMQAAIWPILVASKGQKWVAQLFDKMGLPVVQIYYGDIVDAWKQLATDDKQKNNIRENWERNHAGSKNAAKPYVDVAKVIPLSITPDAANLLETKENAEGDIARAFGVNPLLIGDTEKASYSNIVEIQKNFKLRHNLFIADRLLSGINSMLSQWYPDDVIFIDLDDIAELREDQELKVNMMSTLVNAGIINANEARPEVGFDNGTPDGAKRYVSSSTQPLSAATGSGNHGDVVE